ncbi:testis-specific serine/threonine-protein kinase 1-like protein [Leptotrombidium deliense]|uniref:Testis-specific serine/threonine-protein kinase 1-like protein n=1 Tax=Leptotrombidium deliense TaxID=299467 RepID=A0A443SBS1_9ACAR|nr:testis-specific serine/threonine-protein kinase 1-like protein [Leptotrombidium deliense]
MSKKQPNKRQPSKNQKDHKNQSQAGSRESQPGIPQMNIESEETEELCPPAIAERGYSIHELLGTGAFAKVYKAKNEKEMGDKDMAVKIIKLAKVSLEWKDKCLKVEMKIVKKMQHPHIIKVYEIFKTRRSVFIFMDFADNDTVHGFMQKNQRSCTEREAQPWFSQIAGALSYMHTREVAHRDLKCENILLNRDFSAKLTDFGFACYTYDFKLKTSLLSTTKCGTSAFMAPEVRNPPYDAKKADMWSMGAVLYEMLTFNKPFNENLPDRKVLNAQLKRQWYLPPTLKISEGCRNVLNGLLEPIVDNRLTSEGILRMPWIRGG